MLILPDNSKLALPGDSFTCRVKLDLPLPVEEGAGFVIRDNGRTLGCGKVLKVIVGEARDVKRIKVNKRKARRV